MLSQAEIDALLNGAIELEQPNKEDRVNLAQLIGRQPEEPAEKPESEAKVRPYNFWSPDRFSKEQMRAVELVHEDLAERLTASLPSFVRANLRPRVVHTEQGRFHDFLNDLTPGTLFHILVLAPLPGQTVLTISPDINTVILEQRLGGKTEHKSAERPLTEIDQLLLRGLAEHMLNDIKAAWSKVVSIEPRLEDSTINQHWVQMTMGQERVMLITFEMSLPEFTGTMNIYIPFAALKPIANVLNPHAWIAGNKDQTTDEETRKAALDGVSRVNIPLRVLLGHADLSLGDLIDLEVGDVIPLNTGTAEDLEVQVVDRTRFKARVGRLGKSLAAMVTDVIHPLNLESLEEPVKTRMAK